jgi:hypothetical protein
MALRKLNIEMTALLERLPAYKKIILGCIDVASTPDDILVCNDFMNLFAERFKPLLSYTDFMKHWLDLHDANGEKYLKIITPS